MCVQTANTWQEELNKLEKANDSLKRDVSRFEHKADLEQQVTESDSFGPEKVSMLPRNTSPKDWRPICFQFVQEPCKVKIMVVSYE